MGLLEREVNDRQGEDSSRGDGIEQGLRQRQGQGQEMCQMLTRSRVGQRGIHLVICQASRTSKHFYNPCTNTIATTIAGLHSPKQRGWQVGEGI